MKIKWWYALLLAAPATLILWYLNRQGSNAGHLSTWVFGVALVALVPLAQLSGEVTENLSDYLSPLAKGLLNASFGNVPELAIGIFLLIQAHLHASLTTFNFTIIRGLLIGSVINNVLFTLGIATFFGAFRHGRLRFDAGRAAGYASMLALAVVGLALPTLATTFAPSAIKTGATEENVSLIVGLILIISYIAYIGSELFHWGEKSAQAEVVGPATAEHHASHHAEEHEHGGHEHHTEETAAEKRREEIERVEAEAAELKAKLEATLRDNRTHHPGVLLLAALAFTIVTALTIAICGSLISVTDRVILDTPLTPLSTGFIVFPLICNIGEIVEAVSKAWNRNMEEAMEVAAGSSVQVPLFVTPVLIFIGFAFSFFLKEQPLTLIFQQPLELIVVGLVTFVYALVNLDGETTWLEGAQLLAFYIMIMVTSFALPGQ